MTHVATIHWIFLHGTVDAYVVLYGLRSDGRFLIGTFFFYYHVLVVNSKKNEEDRAGAYQAGVEEEFIRLKVARY